jgi:hypothetical protein
MTDGFVVLLNLLIISKKVSDIVAPETDRLPNDGHILSMRGASLGGFMVVYTS